MAAPKVGDTMIMMADHPDGIQVRSVTALEITAQNDQLVINTDEGAFITDGQGVGAELVPLDPELEIMVKHRGTNFIVDTTDVDIELDSVELDLEFEQRVAGDEGLER